MERVVLLRGINVGGSHRLAMADLRAALADAGCDDVRTYIQSGNAVLSHPEADEGRLVEFLEPAIAAVAGFAVPVVVRTADAWRAAVSANPYTGVEVDPKTLHVLFLSRPPADGALAALELDRFAPEELTAVGREIHLLLPGGLGRSKLAAALTDRTLGAVVTARNWNTVTKLTSMLTPT